MNKKFKTVGNNTRNKLKAKLMAGAIMLSILNFAIPGHVYAFGGNTANGEYESGSESGATAYSALGLPWINKSWDYVVKNCSYEWVSGNSGSAVFSFIDWSTGAHGELMASFGSKTVAMRYGGIATNAGGTIAANDMGFIRGGTEYAELRPNNGNYVRETLCTTKKSETIKPVYR